MTDKRQKAMDALDQWDAFRGQAYAGNILLEYFDIIRAALTTPAQGEISLPPYDLSTEPVTDWAKGFRCGWNMYRDRALTALKNGEKA